VKEKRERETPPAREARSNFVFCFLNNKKKHGMLNKAAREKKKKLERQAG
jgi:hypothetical protein